jgi:hypothetical protein
VLAASDTCVLCGHPGSGDVHHLISPLLRPDLALDPANLRAAHGARSPCPWCGRRCNQVAGQAGELREPPRSRAW